MSNEVVTELDELAAPYGRTVTLENIKHESGLRMLRIRIREGRRFTVMDLDQDTAARWGTVMQEWASGAGNTNHE